MRTRTIRVTQLLVGVATLLASAALIIVIEVASNAIERARLDEATTRDLLAAIAIALVFIGSIAVLVAWVSGRLIASRVAAARGAVLARARGERAELQPAWLAELDELNQAIDRLTSELAARGRALAAEEEQQRVLLDTLSEGILQVDADGRVVRSNQAARALLGLASQPGQRVSTQVRSAQLRRILTEAAAGHDIGISEVRLERRRLLVSVRPLPARGNERKGAVIGIVDLTELRRLEEVRRDFVANVSHELKTPLTSIRGYIETLQGDDLPADMRRQFLDIVRRNADRLQRIIDDLLDLSRLQSGGWRPELAPVRVADVIDDVWSGCRHRADRSGIQFVPPGAGVVVIADAGGLRQIFSNLLDNALRHTPAGGRIEVVAERRTGANGNGTAAEPGGAEPAYILFEVRDNGSGIPSDALARIFERFYRVDPARSRAEGGTGLGLSIVKHLTERMGGAVCADSTLGKGTTIRFRLPAAS